MHLCITVSVSKALEKLPAVIFKGLGKTVHIGGLLFAIYEYYECNMDLAMTCKESAP